MLVLPVGKSYFLKPVEIGSYVTRDIHAKFCENQFKYLSSSTATFAARMFVLLIERI
jgi:hypothetical protein